jgi:hypothetical protein
MTQSDSPDIAANDARTVELLRAGDEAAFGALIDRYNGARELLAEAGSRTSASSTWKATS